MKFIKFIAFLQKFSQNRSKSIEDIPRFVEPINTTFFELLSIFTNELHKFKGFIGNDCLKALKYTS